MRAARSSTIAALALVAIGGCWTSEPARPQTPYPTDEPTAPAPRAPYPLHSEWRGVYRCSQGLTEMTLVLEATPDGKLSAVFEFRPSADAPNVQAGSYRLTGVIRPGPEHTFDIVLEPLAWIDAPAGYVMTALSARSSRKWTRLVGKIEHPACGELDVRRSD